MQVNVTIELPSSLLALSDPKRSQLPFAIAVGLTKAAQEGQRAARSDLPNRFTIRSPFIARNMRIRAATKARQRAEVFWRGPAGSRFGETLERHELGGVKRPEKRYLALPRNVKRGSGGKIPKSQRPGVLLTRKRVYVQEVSGGKAIYRRGSKGSPPTLLYFLTPRPAQIDAALHFRETVTDRARRVWRREFGKAFARAIASRR